MSFTRDWDGKEFDTEDEAYDDYLDKLYLYDDEFIEKFMGNISLTDFIKWATSQPSFEKEFGEEFDTAMRETFEENYIEHEDDFDPYIVGGGKTQRDFY
jgi:hypothetical protein